MSKRGPGSGRKPRRNRLSKFDCLPEKGQQLCVDMLMAMNPIGESKYTYQQVADALNDEYADVLAKNESNPFAFNDLAGILKKINNQAEKAEKKAIMRLEIAKQVSHKLNLDPDDQRTLEEVLEYALYSNECDLTQIDPDKIVKLQLEQRRLKLQEDKFGLDKQKLSLAEQEFDLQMKKLQLEIQRKADGVPMESDQAFTSEIFINVAQFVIDILRSYGELRPLLTKYSTNIAKRLATESERWDPKEAPDG